MNGDINDDASTPLHTPNDGQASVVASSIGISMTVIVGQRREKGIDPVTFRRASASVYGMTESPRISAGLLVRLLYLCVRRATTYSSLYIDSRSWRGPTLSECAQPTRKSTSRSGRLSLAA
jgi:hypothetical protein